MSRDDERSPTAFLLKDEQIKPVRVAGRAKPRLEFSIEQEEFFLLAEATEGPSLNRPKGWPLLTLMTGALLALLLLWINLSVIHFIEQLFLANTVLGWVGLGLGGLAVAAALGMILREIWGLTRLKRLEIIQAEAARAIANADGAAAASALSHLENIYRHRAENRWQLEDYARHRNEVMSPLDRLTLFDRLVLEPLDEQARRLIAKRSRRVTLLTTVTPLAALDMLFVAAQNIGLLRDLATLYGGRPSLISTLKLARLVAGHLAVTGGIALSDNLVQHVLGRGLLGKLSARFGEGAVNGILTSRIGLAARDVCRPLPQPSERRDGLVKQLKELVRDSKTREKGDI